MFFILNLNSYQPIKFLGRVILLNQSNSVSSQTQFLEIVSSKSVVKIIFLIDDWKKYALMHGIQF